MPILSASIAVAVLVAGCSTPAPTAQEPVFQIGFETSEATVTSFEESVAIGALTGTQSWSHSFLHTVEDENITWMSIVLTLERDRPPQGVPTGESTRIEYAWMVEGPDGTRHERGSGTMTGHRLERTWAGLHEHLNPVPAAERTEQPDQDAAEAYAAGAYTATNGTGTWTVQVELTIPPQAEPWGNEVTVGSEVGARHYRSIVHPAE